MYSPQLSENLWQRISADHGRCASDAQPSAMGAGQRSQFFDGRIMLAQDRICALEQLLTGLCQNHASRGADEKLGSRLSLQLTDLHADGRLCYVDPGCSGRESAAFRNGYECFQLSNVHNPESCAASTWIITWIRSFSFHYS